MANSPLVLAGVVQANAVLYDPEQSTWAPAVVAFTTDPRYALDAGYMQQLIQHLRQCRDHHQPDPEANRFGDLLRDENSEFYHHPLPASLTGGVDARASVTYLDPERLPGGVIPPSGLLPAIATPDNIHFLPPAAVHVDHRPGSRPSENSSDGGHRRPAPDTARQRQTAATEWRHWICPL